MRLRITRARRAGTAARRLPKHVAGATGAPVLLALALTALLVAHPASARAEAEPGPPAAPAPPIVTPLSPGEAAPPADPTVETNLVADMCRGNSPASLLEITTLFGHKRYANAPAGSLVRAPRGFAAGGCQALNREAVAALRDLVAAARSESPAVARDLVAVSCYRSTVRQKGVYCNRAELSARGFIGQAYWIAPPGFSEHATGLALDFGTRSSPRCNLQPCFAETAVGQWLAANAARFGFELSFAPDNAQGVAYEPWHFRFVGSDAAKLVFGTGPTVSGPAPSAVVGVLDD